MKEPSLSTGTDISENETGKVDSEGLSFRWEFWGIFPKVTGTVSACLYNTGVSASTVQVCGESGVIYAAFNLTLTCKFC